MTRISLIIPCFNNELNLPDTTTRLLEAEKQIEEDIEFEYVMVEDGSKDKTYDELLKFQRQHPEKVKLVRLVRNFGSNAAVLAGLSHCSGDCCVVISADLQDPPELISKMYTYWKKGIKLVLANRTGRKESVLKKFNSGVFHFLMRKLALSGAPKGGFDTALFDRELKDHMVKMNERNIFWPYLLVWLGYDYVSIPYERQKRLVGSSGWTTSKKVKTFIDSFVAFSFFPIRIITIIGLVLGMAAFGYGLVIVYYRLSGSIDTEGWSSLMVVILMVSAFQMIALGIIGEYVWRNLDTARKRPNFIVDQVVDETNNELSSLKEVHDHQRR